ncbi:MAG: hypothetical protein ACRD3I_13570, partial [Terriglobales bacterium]
VIVVVTVFAVFLYFKIQHDAFRNFLLFYFGIVFLIFLAWAFGQLATTRRAQTEDDLLDIELKKQEEGPVKTYTLQIGNAPSGGQAGPGTAPSGQISESHSFNLQVGNIPIEPIDEGLLALADEYVRQGKGIEWVCGVMSPKYAELSTVGREAYRAFFQASLDAWRAKVYGSTPSSAPTPAAPAPSPQSFGTSFEAPRFDRAFPRAPSPATPKEDQPPRGLFTKAEVLVFVVVFLAVCAAIVTALILFRGVQPE